MKLLALLVCFAGMASAETLALVCAENNTTTCDNAVAAFQATGDFTSVVGFDANTAAPTLATDIAGYDAVIAWSDNALTDPNGLGTVLANYYALGDKRLTIASFSFNTGYAIGGPIGDPNSGYSALIDTGAPSVTASGNLVAVVPSDVIFTGINLSAIGYYPYGLANPGLASGATLLATDGAGVDMIARSSLGVVDVNIWPGIPNPTMSLNNPELYDLLAQTASPEPSTFVFLGIGLLAMAGAVQLRRRKRATDQVS